MSPKLFAVPTKMSVAAALALGGMLASTLGSGYVAAQSFFQQLFGFSSTPQVQAPPRPVAPGPSFGSGPIRLGPISPDQFSHYQQRGPSSYSSEGAGSYTTVCVRMCDGYYFPISYRVPRSRFHRDADACNARCGESEARLFYHPSGGGDMDSAVDLTGRSYSALPIAYMHRKQLVPGCACKPAPWSDASIARHEGYAIAEGRPVRGSMRMASSAGGSGSFSVVAGSYSDRAAAPAAAGSEPGERGWLPLSEPAEDTTAPGPMAARSDDSGLTGEVPAARVVTPQRRPVVHSTAGTPRTAPRTAPRPATASGPQRKSMRIASAGGSGGRLVWPGDAR